MSIRRAYRSVAMALSIGLIASLGSLAVAAPADAAVTALAPESIVVTVGTPVASAALDVTTLTAGAITYSIGAAPALPAGLSFEPTAGVISGTPTAATVLGTSTITAADGINSVTKDIAITIDGILSAASIVANAGVDLTGTTAITTTGMGAGLAFTAPSLPPGLLMDAGTGQVTGVPTALSSATPYPVSVTDSGGAHAAGSITISVVLGSLSPAAQSVSGRVGVPVATVAFPPPAGAATYAIGPPITTVPGLSFDTTTGIVSGTPTVPIVATTFTVTQSVGAVETASGTITVSVDGVFASSPQTVLATAGTDIPAMIAFGPSAAVAAGLVAPLTFTVSPALPAGLVIDSLTGTISGLPTMAALAAAYTVTATSGVAGPKATGVVTITVAGLLSPAVQSLTGGVGARLASAPFTATGLTLPVIYTIAPSPPAGLVLDSSTGVLSGTPSTVSAGVSLLVTATDGSGARATARITLNVAKGQSGGPVIGSVLGGPKPGTLMVYFAKPLLSPPGEVFLVTVYDESGLTLITTVSATASPVLVSGLVPGDSYQVIVVVEATSAHDRLESLPKAGTATAGKVTTPVTANVSTNAPTNVTQAPLRAVAPVKLGGGWFVIPPDSSSKVKRVVVLQGPSAQSSAAPVVRVRANRVVSLRVKGLPIGTLVVAEVFLKGRWVSMGGVRSNARGVVDLPAFRATKAGRTLMRLTSTAQPSVYLSVVVRAKG